MKKGTIYAIGGIIALFFVYKISGSFSLPSFGKSDDEKKKDQKNLENWMKLKERKNPDSLVSKWAQYARALNVALNGSFLSEDEDLIKSIFRKFRNGEDGNRDAIETSGAYLNITKGDLQSRIVALSSASERDEYRRILSAKGITAFSAL